MKKVLSIVLAIIVLLGGIFIGISNSLVSADEDCNESLSNIDVMIQRKSNVVKELMGSIKGQMAHEEKIFSGIAEARKGVTDVAGSNDPEALEKANQKLDQEIQNLIHVVHEAYPELASSESFQEFNDSIEGSNNRIAQARREYNETATAYNKKIRMFPTDLIANIKGMSVRALFKTDEGVSEEIDIDFNNN